MAKVVSTKFGDRRLVNLPPVDLHGTKTPVVNTIEPAKFSSTDRSVPFPSELRHAARGNITGPRIIPKEYSYKDQQPRENAARKPYTGGNLVDAQFKRLEEAIVDKLTARYEAPVFQGYTMVPVAGQQQPVVPQNYLGYTQQALQPMIGTSTQQPPPQPAPEVQQPPAPIQGPPPQPKGGYPSVPFFGVDPNEKHIFYGPGGEVLQGPPPWLKQGGHIAGRHGRLDLEDFDIQGTLVNGKLTTVRLTDGFGTFPRIPEYLSKDLQAKYYQHERTEVRIIAKDGQINVHATPQIKNVPVQQTEQYIPTMPIPINMPAKVNAGPVVKYMPVYIDDEGNVVDKGDLYDRPDKIGAYGANIPDRFPVDFPGRRPPQRPNLGYAPAPIATPSEVGFEIRRNVETRDRNPFPLQGNYSRIDTAPAFPPAGTQTPTFTTRGRNIETADPLDGYRWRYNDSRYETRYDSRRHRRPSPTRRRFSPTDGEPETPPDTRALRF